MLSLIGQGCHRLSEIAGRIGKPAGHLSRPLAQLIDLGHIRRDMPFGETTRSTKRTLYRLNDPFLAFWYRYVQPHRSMLEQDRMDILIAEYEKMQAHHIAGIWEDLARKSVAKIDIAGLVWKPAQPWWGNGLNGKPMEIDVMTESVDGEALLIGEVKWEKKTGVAAIKDRLMKKATGARSPDQTPHTGLLGATSNERRRRHYNHSPE